MISAQRKIAISDSYTAPVVTGLWRLSLALCFACANAAWAGPWIDPGDISLRNDIQLLSDAGIIRAPVMTWPLSIGDVLGGIDEEMTIELGPGQRRALMRLRRLEKAATVTDEIIVQAAVSLAEQPRELRGFEDTPRETAQARIAMDWTGLRFSYRLSLTSVSGPDDHQSARADGSYFGAVLGNYMLSVGEMDRWWGPGWDGSLIFSSNPRPIPAIALRRNFSYPFETKWLSWMGPWTFSVLWGQLESDRAIPDAQIFGLRVDFRPSKNLEIGLSRTAQWCGKGRPCDLGTFTDLLAGQDNSGENQTSETEPGNQLAGVDWRWRLPGRVPVAWYGQFIGEDEAGGLPSRMIGQLGVEAWAYSSRLAGTIRAHLEVSDTAAEYYSQVRYDYAYEHFLYSDGYRYRGRVIGHSMDGDGRMISAGVTLDTDHGDQWRGLFRIVDLNRGGMTANPLASSSLDLVNIELGYTAVLSGGRLGIGVGVDQLENWLMATDETDFRAHISWQSEF